MTDDEMSDEKFEHWLQSAARDYNRPADAMPPARRDAMWAAIEGTLDAAASAPVAPAGVTPIHRGRLLPRTWQAAAAVAILAAGIGIGRLWSMRGAPSGDAPVVAAAPDLRSGTVPGGEVTLADTALRGTLRGDRAATAPAASGATGLADDRSRIESYDVAAVQHLTRAEALLTAFRASEGTEASVSMDRWARDLLADTRLLLDSPAATDARRRHLLEDLELVLAQIVQLPAESSADRGLVQRSIERGAVLSRLRSTIPAGFASGT